MTRIEADVCYKYRLQVNVAPKIAERFGLSPDKGYFITEIIKAYDGVFKKTFYTAVLSGDGRALYHMDITDLNYLEAQEGFVQSKVQQEKAKQFAAMLKEIYEKHKTKKAVYQFIGKEIDKLKVKENA